MEMKMCIQLNPDHRGWWLPVQTNPFYAGFGLWEKRHEHDQVRQRRWVLQHGLPEL